MDIPPPPPPPPSPDDAQPSGTPPYPGAPGRQPPQNPYAAQAQEPTQAAMPGQQFPQPPVSGQPPQNPYAAPAGNPYAPPADPYAAQGGNPYAAPADPYGTSAGQPGYGYPGAQPQPGYGYPGPAMPPPYPGQPGWYGQERRTNGISIAALVTGIIPCTFFLGIIFGLVGMKQVKQRAERGRGMAIAGVVLGGVWAALWAVLITLGAMGKLDDGNTSIGDLKAGQCFNTVNDELSGTEGPPTLDDKKVTHTVDVVDCSDEHDAEAYDVYQIQADRDAPYPGVDKVGADAQDTCVKNARSYLDGKTPASGIHVYFYIPPPQDWAANHRQVICFFGFPDGKVTGTMKERVGGGGSGDDGQENGDDKSGVGV
ncbi:DUF4190 domain-containing protein [Streptomyces sp. NRRL F-5123]|uniref:DUF4190 domain-containing protein n=1 Tax=Streptomyces sp. NRRL F-5123 TaxID=1463856 RepID=UPI0004E1FA3C|nr:DUF4190 domain-containing protein [Streptomyces sp. NRRL F-5123]